MRCRVWVQALGQNQIQRYFKHFSGPCITPLLPEGEEHIFTLTGKTQYLQKLWSLTDGNRRCGKHQLLIPGFPTICIDVNSQALKHLKTSIICMEEIMGNPRKDEKVEFCLKMAGKSTDWRRRAGTRDLAIQRKQERQQDCVRETTRLYCLMAPSLKQTENRYIISMVAQMADSWLNGHFTERILDQTDIWLNDHLTKWTLDQTDTCSKENLTRHLTKQTFNQTHLIKRTLD